MDSVWGKTLLIGAVGAIVSLTSCKQIKASLGEFANGGEKTSSVSGSLAEAEGLPVVTSFERVTPQSVVSFTGAGDRISVLEFYSET